MSPAPHPRMHGLTHVTGGPDPIPGLLPYPGDDIAGRILQLGPDAFWKLDEPSGDTAHDSSGNDHHLTTEGETWTAPEWGQEAGPPGDTTAGWGGSTTRVGSPSGEPLTAFTDDFTAGVWINVQADGTSPSTNEVMGQGTSLHGEVGWNIMFVDSTGTRFAVAVAGNLAYANEPLELDTWYLVAVVRDTGTWKLYIDGLLQAETLDDSPGTGYGGNTWLGNDAFSGHSSFLRDSLLSYAFIVDRPLASTDLLEIMAGEDTGSGAGGYVLTVDENGQPVWAPPGTEVEHGGGEPVEGPVTYPGSGSFDGPPSPSGWEYVTHREILVLYDSTPARFDVPSRKWTRVPFNTVRIQRTWETVPGGTFKQAWLPDDRGVTAAAKDGVLKVTADMGFDFGEGLPAYEPFLSGWFSIEYPVLDYEGLPQSDPPLIDPYLRVARMVNTRTGQIVRVEPGSAYRAFAEWPFSTEAAALVGGWFYAADNPYPVLPSMPGRPLHKPLPYPQMSPTESVTYYTDTAGNPGFGGLANSLGARVTLAAGDTFVLQAWQDSPWLLRFSTDHFPNFGGFAAVGPWMNQPWLKLEYYYDPETIDHTTGRLL